MTPIPINPPIDFQLAELLGEKPQDFLVLHFDDQPAQGFGTPFDSPLARAQMEAQVTLLNERDTFCVWPDVWANRAKDLIKQFNLPPTTTAEQFHPTASYKIHRIVAGYSSHIGVAMGLLEKLQPNINGWEIACAATNAVRFGVTLRTIGKVGDITTLSKVLPSAIAKAVLIFLQSTAA